MNKKGLSILEILISAVLLALVVTGLANIFVAAKRFILHSRSRMTAAERVRGHLEPLQMEVDQSKYILDAGGNWSWVPSVFGPWMDSSTVILYSPNYKIDPLDLGSNIAGRTSEVNRVDLRINWDERTQE